MSEKRKEIYARFGVQLVNSRRAYRAEKLCDGAMGLYAFAVMYARDELTSPPGFVPEEVLLSAWGRPEWVREPQAAALVSVHLLERVEGGWRVVKYEEHNDTAEEVESNREAARERMRIKRASVRGTFSERSSCVRGTMGERSPDVPISISISDSDLGSRSEDPSSTPRATPPPPPAVPAVKPLGTIAPPPHPIPDAKRAPDPAHGPAIGIAEEYLPDAAGAPPGWWSGAIATIETTTGVRLAPGEAWLRYAGHRGGGGPRSRPANRNDALQWLTSVMVKEARESREKERERARNRGGPPASFSEPQKLDAEEQKRLAEQFPMAVRKRVPA